jgi:hypothetical protein
MKIKLMKFGEILTSRPAGREAGLAILAYFKPKRQEKIELDFSGVLSCGPSWLDEVLTALVNAYGKDRVLCKPTKNASVIESLQAIKLSH